MKVFTHLTKFPLIPFTEYMVLQTNITKYLLILSLISLFLIPVLL